jgi:hypothetical protein
MNMYSEDKRGFTSLVLIVKTNDKKIDNVCTLCYNI